MGGFELQLRNSQSINGIAADPQPDWSFDNLLHELNSIEQKQNVTLDFPVPFVKTQPRKLRASKNNYPCQRGFIMHVSDKESDSSDADSEDDHDTSYSVSGKRFTCNDLYLSDDSEPEDSRIGVQSHLMDKPGLVECALHEVRQEFHLRLSEEVRFNISSLESELVHENEKFGSLIAKVDKDREQRREKDRKFDLLYQRTIAEALDNHLTALQRDHEHIYQLEEKRIRDDAAREEAKRKEKALQEEKLRQERIKAEEEAKIKAEKAERAKAAAIEAEKRAAEEAASKRANETSRDHTHNAVEDSTGSLRPSDSASDVKKEVHSSAINVVKASKNALDLEKRRKQIYDELIGKNEAIKASANQDYRKHEQNMSRQIRTIASTMENIRTRAETLVQLINSPGCPQSISIQMFVEKIVSHCTPLSSLNAVVATACVIVLVTSKLHLAFDILISKLNRVCIYTVPKHIFYSEAAFESKDAYLQAIGKEKSESLDSYIERLKCSMRLYGALVQTEVGNFDNLHGLREGWGWLAMFLNTLPANLYTAVALQSFLEMAGFALYRRYKNQFEKLLGIIACDFLNALKEGEPTSLTKKLIEVKLYLKDYIELKLYKKKPQQELQLTDHLESGDVFS